LAFPKRDESLVQSLDTPRKSKALMRDYDFGLLLF
jgi:hypothetical protein